MKTERPRVDELRRSLALSLENCRARAYAGEDEPADAAQQRVLQDMHLQQAAGITEMIQGVKDNLMQQQRAQPGSQPDADLEIFSKLGGGGFGEVFKGRFRGVRRPSPPRPAPFPLPLAPCMRSMIRTVRQPSDCERSCGPALQHSARLPPAHERRRTSRSRS